MLASIINEVECGWYAKLSAGLSSRSILLDTIQSRLKKEKYLVLRPKKDLNRIHNRIRTSRRKRYGPGVAAAENISGSAYKK